MNWFKKSIAYDQKRRLIFLPVLIILPIIFSIMGILSILKSEEILLSYRDITIGIGGTSYLAILVVVAIIAIASIGIRDKSEISYMESMPMKLHDVTMTRLTCASAAVIIPLILGFLLSTMVYITNKDILLDQGYLYLDIVYRYSLICLISLSIIGLVYLASVLYKNIKVPIVLGIGGIISIIGILAAFSNCFKYGNPIHDKISFMLDNMIYAIRLPINEIAVYYPITLAVIITLLGVVILLFVLISYITSSVSNDVYDKLFSFKASKIIYYIFSVSIIMGIFGALLSLVADYTYINSVLSTVPYDDAVATSKLLFARRVMFGTMVVLLPLWIFISKKIGEKLEERF